MTYAGTASSAPARVSAAAGPGLRHAEAEAEEIGRLWPGGEVVVGEEATVSRMIELLGSPGIVHLAAHGRHEPDNPLFSSVRMADGPLFAHELDSGGASPDLVLLSSCEVGRASIRAGGEALGLASVLLRTGVGCVVAALAPLPDATALAVMTRTHALLRHGGAGGAGRRDGDRGGRGADRGRRAAGLLRRPALRAIWSPSGGCRTLGGPKDRRSSTVSCARSARARSPEVPQQRRPAQVRVPGWFGLRRAACRAPRLRGALSLCGA